MLIEALCRYCDILIEDENLIPDGWTNQDITKVIVLDRYGNIADVLSYTEDKKIGSGTKTKIKKMPVKVLLPYREQTTTTFAYNLDHRPDYIFGLCWDKDNKCLSTNGKTAGGKEKSVLINHNLYVKRNLEFIDGLHSELIDAFRLFLENWNPEEHINDEILVSLGKEFSSSGYCFALSGKLGEILCYKDALIKSRVDELLENSKNNEGSESVTGNCAITGEKNVNIARIHPQIKHLFGSQASGASLVCFNDSSDESYMKSQSYNSSISEDAANKYSKALNFLLENSNHNVRYGNMTVVYWAMGSSQMADNACYYANMAFGGQNSVDNEDTEELKENIMNLNNALNSIMKISEKGRVNVESLKSLDIDPEMEFYVAGLVPYKSRISVKFCCRNTVGKLMENLINHMNDMSHDGMDNLDYKPSVGSILYALEPNRQSDNKSDKEKKGNNINGNYPLYSSIMSSITNGSLYPDELLWESVKRCKTNNEKIAAVRIGIIKACLNRKARFKNNREVITMALNKENTNPAYLCGRLFAILEMIQRDAIDPKHTIKDAYFSSAVTKPGLVFPKLIMLAQHHLDKIGDGIYSKSDDVKSEDEVKSKRSGKSYDKMIQEIFVNLNSFPTTLNIDEQGEFIIGYYQQKNQLYTKTNKSENNND